MNLEYIGIGIIVIAAIYVLTRKKKPTASGGSGTRNTPGIRDNKESK